MYPQTFQALAASLIKDYQTDKQRGEHKNSRLRDIIGRCREVSSGPRGAKFRVTGQQLLEFSDEYNLNLSREAEDSHGKSLSNDVVDLFKELAQGRSSKKLPGVIAWYWTYTPGI